jgi:hypothetical protein
MVDRGITVVGEAHLSKRLLELMHCPRRMFHGSSASGGGHRTGAGIWSAKLAG